MESYAFIFYTFTYVNTIILILSSIIGVFMLRKSKSKILKIVAYYLFVCCFFDVITGFIVSLLKQGFLEGFSTIYLGIVFRLVELLLIGYIINKHWLKSKIMWLLMMFSSIYLLYDLFTFQSKGILNYEARAQTVANFLLLGLIVVNLLKQLKDAKQFNVTNQMLSMVFLTYFSIHLVYTVIQNFIINQSFTNKSFALFYSSYAILHIIYYAALG
ncbi:MAG: hypothetical protein RSE50_05190, partial [Myroides sp.]